ncbi:MAG: rhomboid family intramembrane serine protease [Spirochaetota bacterium]
MDAHEKRHLLTSIYFTVLFVLLLWLVKSIEMRFQVSFAKYGVYPGTLQGLRGLLFAPLLHVDLGHLLANTPPICLSLAGIFYLYREASVFVIPIIYFFSNLGVWLFGRKAFHIGASGLIYGFLCFIFFSGVFRRERRAIALALIVTFLYGGIMVSGVLPAKESMSYEAHLSGAILGIILAFFFRKMGPPEEEQVEEELVPEWEEEIWGTYSN